MTNQALATPADFAPSEEGRKAMIDGLEQLAGGSTVTTIVLRTRASRERVKHHLRDQPVLKRGRNGERVFSQDTAKAIIARLAALNTVRLLRDQG